MPLAIAINYRIDLIGILVAIVVHNEILRAIIVSLANFRDGIVFKDRAVNSAVYQDFRAAVLLSDRCPALYQRNTSSAF